MYRNKKAGKVLTDEDVDEFVSSWAADGTIGRPRECVIADLIADGFEYVDDAELSEDERTRSAACSAFVLSNLAAYRLHSAYIYNTY